MQNLQVKVQSGGGTSPQGPLGPATVGSSPQPPLLCALSTGWGCTLAEVLQANQAALRQVLAWRQLSWGRARGCPGMAFWCGKASSPGRRSVGQEAGSGWSR